MHHGLSAYVTYQMKADSSEATGTIKGGFLWNSIIALLYFTADLFKVTVTGYKLQLHFEKCNQLQLHEVTFRKNVTGYSYMKLLFKKM